MKNRTIFKHLFFISFFLISNLSENAYPVLIVCFIYLYQTLNDIFTNAPLIFWEGMIVIPLIGTLIIAQTCKLYKERDLYLFCLVVLYLFLTAFLFNLNEVHLDAARSLWFLIPLLLFVISSIYLLYLNFKKPIKQIN